MTRVSPDFNFLRVIFRKFSESVPKPIYWVILRDICGKAWPLVSK